MGCLLAHDSLRVISDFSPHIRTFCTKVLHSFMDDHTQSSSRLYTGTGDQGKTWGLNGPVDKASGSITLLGEIDTINAVVGWVLACGLERHKTTLKRIQWRCLDIGAWLALQDTAKPGDLELLTDEIKFIEKCIDENCNQTPPLCNFVLPGGSELAARLHILRGNVRNAERVFWKHMPQKTQVHVYLNRLSDWAFSEARMVLHEAGLPDIIWKQGETW